MEKTIEVKADLTFIIKDPNKDELPLGTSDKKQLAAEIKNRLDADDIRISKVRVFEFEQDDA